MTLGPRPQESQYAETVNRILDICACVNTSSVWCIQFGITRPDEYATAIYIWQLLASRRAQTEPAMWFRGILNFFVPIFFSKMARPPCTLSHQALVNAGQTQNLLWRFRRRRFTRLRLVLWDSTNWMRLTSSALIGGKRPFSVSLFDTSKVFGIEKTTRAEMFLSNWPFLMFSHLTVTYRSRSGRVCSCKYPITWP